VVILTLKYVKAYKKDNNVKIEYLDIWRMKSFYEAELR
jgi:hypothetical protein